MFKWNKRDRDRRDLSELVEDLLEELIDFFRNKNRSREPVTAEGKLDNMQNATRFTFTEFDANGNIVPIDPTKNPIAVSSDNPAVATVGAGTLNADGSMTFPVTSVGNGTANIVGVDAANLGADGKPLAAGDTDTVSVAVGPPVRATGVLS
jgi:hypothetical protein